MAFPTSFRGNKDPKWPFWPGHPPAPVAAAAGPTNIAVGLVTETDSAQAITRSKQRTLGLIAETDAAQAITRVKRVTLGLITETDAAQSITRQKSKALGLTAETDASQAVTRRRQRTLGLIAETDAAQAITASNFTITDTFTGTGFLSAHTADTGQTWQSGGFEPNTGNSGNATLGSGVITNNGTQGYSAEINQAIVGTFYVEAVIKATGAAGEAGVALINGSAGSRREYWQYTWKSDGTIQLSGVSSAPVYNHPLGSSSLPWNINDVHTLRIVYDSAAGLIRIYLDGVAQGSTAASLISIPDHVGVIGWSSATGVVTDTFHAGSGGLLAPVLGFAAETDAAQAITRRKTRATGLIAETDTAQGTTRQKRKTLGFVSETDAAQAASRRKSRTLGFVAETNTAQVAARQKRKTLGLATETDTVFTITRTAVTYRNLGLITETDTAFHIRFGSTRIHLGFVTETDSTVMVVVQKISHAPPVVVAGPPRPRYYLVGQRYRRGLTRRIR